MDHLKGLRVVHGACSANRHRVRRKEHFIVSIAEDMFVAVVPDALCRLTSFQNLSTSLKPRWYVLSVKISWFLEKKTSATARV